MQNAAAISTAAAGEIQDHIHGQIVRRLDRLQDWFRSIREGVDVPFYSSYDVRDAGFKLAIVDANIYPAGFNNICGADREHAGELVRFYLERHYGGVPKKILVLTEEHTSNPYYWDNVRALKQIIEEAGRDVRLAIPRREPCEPFLMKSASGADVEVYGACIQGGRIACKDFEPDLVVSNNDFSEFYEEWGPEILTPMNPPRELGWYRRKKSEYFRCYNELASEFAGVIEVDPWLLTVETELVSGFDLADERSREAVAQKVEALLARTRERYRQRGVSGEPVAFLKNNAGTYGLAVMRVQSGDDVRSLNNKSRKKMKAAKGGRDVEEVIIQEGIPSITRAEGVTAEPAIYMLGCQLAGGFLRTHKEKDPTESLNSPGAVYKRLCVSDLKVSVEGNPMENVYGWIAKVGALAIGRESAAMNVAYRDYKRGPC